MGAINQGGQDGWGEWEHWAKVEMDREGGRYLHCIKCIMGLQIGYVY